MANRPSKHRHTVVAYAYLCSGKVDAPFLDSVLAMREYDIQNQNYLDPRRGGGRIHVQTSPRVAEARSQVVDTFVRPKAQGGLFANADWLLFLDSDGIVPPDLLEQMMRYADPVDCPILGALAFGGTCPDDMFPTIYTLTRDDNGDLDIDKVYNYPRNTLCKVGGTGAHCILIHRSVFVHMFKNYEKLPNGNRNPYPWFAEGHMDSRGMPIGEDIIFCFR